MPKTIRILVIGASGFHQPLQMKDLYDRLCAKSAKKGWLVHLKIWPSFTKATLEIEGFDEIEAINFVYDTMLMRYDEFLEGCVNVGKALRQQGKAPLVNFEDQDNKLAALFRAYGMYVTTGDFVEACDKRWNARPATLVAVH